MILASLFERIIALDERMLLTINGAWTPLLDHVMKFLSSIPVWIPLYLAIAIAAFFRRSYSTRCGGYAIRVPVAQGKFWLMGVAAVASFIIACLVSDWGTNLVKVLVARPRPGYNPVTAAAGRFPTGTGTPYGFFSGHAANTFCYAVLAGNILGRRWLKICLLVWAALVA